ncbi:hypothetical protein TrRE_jg13445, partial [Triparma retinervis]
MPSRNVFDG